jgi:heptosyltransferase-2
MTTPALLRLREKFPAAHITLLTPEKLADLWRHHPNIDSVITFTAGESLLSVALKLRSLNPKRFDELPEVLPGDTLARVFARVTNILSASAFDGRLGFDLALILPNSPRSALEVWLAGIPWRIGYASPWRNWFLTEAVPARAEAVKMRKRSVGEIKQLIRGTGFQPVPPLNAHQMHEYLHLAGALGANPEPLPPQLVVTPDEIEAVKKKFGLKEIERPIFGLNPGAEYGPAKRWPVEKFIAATRDIQQRTNCVWLIFGGRGDIALTGQIAAALHASRFPFHDLSGKTSLRELMALLKVCHVLLTNDSGPMHVAAALGTPVVVPFGSTSPELTGPGLPGNSRNRVLKSAAPCSPCFRRECPIDFRCMSGISVERIVEAVLQCSGAL